MNNPYTVKRSSAADYLPLLGAGFGSLYGAIKDPEQPHEKMIKQMKLQSGEEVPENFYLNRRLINSLGYGALGGAVTLPPWLIYNTLSNLAKNPNPQNQHYL